MWTRRLGREDAARPGLADAMRPVSLLHRNVATGSRALSLTKAAAIGGKGSALAAASSRVP